MSNFEWENCGGCNASTKLTDCEPCDRDSCNEYNSLLCNYCNTCLRCGSESEDDENFIESYSNSDIETEYEDESDVESYSNSDIETEYEDESDVESDEVSE